MEAATTTERPATDQATGSSSSPSADAAAAPEQDQPNYIVLAAREQPDAVATEWAVVGEYAADGQRNAKKQATANPHVSQALGEGAEITLVAIPLSSWSPSTVQLEQVPPRVRGL